MSKKRYIAAALALCMALTLAGCGADPGARLIEGIPARDAAKLCSVTMASEIRLPDGQSGYLSTAAWDDGNGVRHMHDARSEVDAGGKLETTESEAWSGPERAYINTGSGWMERDAGTGAERPAALDLDAAFSLIGRLGKLSEKKDLAVADGEYGTKDVSFPVRFSDVRKLAGGAAEGLGLDDAVVTCRFRQDVLESVTAEAGSPDGGDGYFRVTATISAWNADGWDASIPDDIVNPPTEQEILIDKADQDILKAYAAEYDVPDDFANSGLEKIAEELSDGSRFDKILAESHDGFDEIQYHTHGAVGDGYWAAALSVEEYLDADAARKRHAELQAFNDAWYGTGLADGPWGMWEGLEPGRVHGEILRMAGDTRVILVQVEAASAGELDDGALTGIAKQIAGDAGLDGE